MEITNARIESVMLAIANDREARNGKPIHGTPTRGLNVQAILGQLPYDYREQLRADAIAAAAAIDDWRFS